MNWMASFPGSVRSPGDQHCLNITVVQLRKYKLCTVLPICRTPHSVNDFCGQLFGSWASYLHLRLILYNYETVWAKSTVLTIPKYQQRTVLFTNKRKYKSREHGTNNFGNGATKHLRIFVYIFLVVFFSKNDEYDEVNFIECGCRPN